jgi:hypothetical protein
VRGEGGETHETINARPFALLNQCPYGSESLKSMKILFRLLHWAHTRFLRNFTSTCFDKVAASSFKARRMIKQTKEEKRTCFQVHIKLMCTRNLRAAKFDIFFVTNIYAALGRIKTAPHTTYHKGP